MLTQTRYQVFAFGGSHDGRTAILFETLRLRTTELGLSSTNDLILAEDPDVALIDTARTPTASVFFGGASRRLQIDDAVTALRRRGVFVLPVVPDIAKYKSYVPSSLLGINGIPANPGGSSPGEKGRTTPPLVPYSANS